MADKPIGEITKFLIEMAADGDAPAIEPRESLIAEINGYLDELETLGIKREKFDFETITDSYLQGAS